MIRLVAWSILARGITTTDMSPSAHHEVRGMSNTRHRGALEAVGSTGAAVPDLEARGESYRTSLSAGDPTG